jgi:hypothetical protein
VIGLSILISSPPSVNTLDEVIIEIDDIESDVIIADGEQHTITMIAYDIQGDRLKDCNITLSGRFRETPLSFKTDKEGVCTAIVTPELYPGEDSGEITIKAKYSNKKVTMNYYKILVNDE